MFGLFSVVAAVALTEVVAILVAVAILGLISLIAMRPAEFRVTRSATMAAPPSKPFEQVNDLRNWEEWSPWAKLDTGMSQSYEGPRSGSGAKYSWSGNKKVGEGRMEITESRPDKLVGIRLEFLRPIKATNDVEFTFSPTGDGTTVTWTMTGRNNFAAKAFGLFMNIDKMCGSDFEKGLAGIKSRVES